MPIAPDVVAEFVFGPTCPPQSVLDELTAQIEAITPPLPGDQPASLTVCTSHPEVGENYNVVAIGLWGDTSGSSESERHAALAERPVQALAALYLSTNAIQSLIAAAWAATDKTIGRVTLDDNIDVAVEYAGANSGRIVTTVRGVYDSPFLWNIDFTFTMRDELSLEVGEENEFVLQNQRSTAFEPGVLPASLMSGLLRPILGGIVFFSTPSVAGDQAADARSVGDALAAQWPFELLTANIPPFLRGKTPLLWSTMLFDDRGVTTTGTSWTEPRMPTALIVGPRSVSIREALGAQSASYRVDTRDLRPPLDIQWGGVAHGQGQSVRALFHNAGRHSVRVTVRDVDGQSDADELTVVASIIPLQGGQQPF